MMRPARERVPLLVFLCAANALRRAQACAPYSKAGRIGNATEEGER